jgi:hypothetical protein
MHPNTNVGTTTHTYPPAASTAATYQRPLTVKEFYHAIGGVIGLNTLYDYCRSKRIRCIKVRDRKLLILPSEVTEFFIREAAK